MITVLARGEMSTIILPVQDVVMSCALLALLGGVSLMNAAWTMRDSRDWQTRDHANATFFLGLAMAVIPLIMAIVCMFIYWSQGGFE